MKRKFRPLIYIVFFLFIFPSVFSQKLELKISAKDSINKPILETINYSRFHSTEKSITSEIDSISINLHRIGYINNVVKQTSKKDSITSVIFSLGKKSEIVKVFYDSKIVSQETLNNNSLKVNDMFFTSTVEQIPIILNKIVEFLESSGNTFVEVSLKNHSYTKFGIEAKLNIENLKNRTISNIIVNGYDKFPKSFIKHYLNLQKETIFNSKKVSQISEAINSLNFVSEIKPSEILFTKDSTNIYLYLQKIKSNVFDGLIGFSTNENGKLEFNGHLDLLLNNIFNTGENIAIKWKSNGNEQKLFNLKLETPYIFNSKITPRISFSIYKQDSTFLNTKVSLDLKYNINPQTIIAAKYQSEKSNDLTSINSQTAINEFNNNFYGFSFEKKILNIKSFPQNKFFFHIDAIWGNRISTTESTTNKQSKYELTTYYNWILNQKNSIFIQNQSAILVSDNLFENELFRIGGTNSIRGFNEQSIFNSSHSILNLEYRYHLSNSTFIYNITDFAQINNDNSNINTQLYSFGLGYQYRLKNGFVNLSYAIGKESDSSIDLDNSRIHIKFQQFF